ncbi:hypothetical protein [Conexibacter arvalis]|uniref:Uncharacterized protein n=1 Tax=Conexibacter arvalis TaxID=912552 RepID=A0A840IL85_9ACTN|nr:hypothetical protein [Conexibacter arvalis]MBB4664893.1 hypothetical protein [Conexibacter arvalis]
MAQTKKKRQTKHRGNAAGQIEARGRTGRKPSERERKLSARDEARAKRLERLDQPPTWRGALNRAAIATAFFFVLLVLLFRDQPFASKIFIALFMLLVYVPMGYYTDLFVYRRRQAKRLKERAAAGGRRGDA